MDVVPFGVVCDTDKMTCSLGFSLSTGVLLTTIFHLPVKENPTETVVVPGRLLLQVGCTHGLWETSHRANDVRLMGSGRFQERHTEVKAKGFRDQQSDAMFLPISQRQ